MIRSAIAFKYHRPPHTTAPFCLLKAALTSPPPLSIACSKEAPKKALCPLSSESAPSSFPLSHFSQAGPGLGTLVYKSGLIPASLHLEIIGSL